MLGSPCSNGNTLLPAKKVMDLTTRQVFLKSGKFTENSK